MSAVGVASPSAHGHAMMSTATAAVKAAVGVARDDEPAGERRERERDHDRDEDARDAVDEPLDRRLPRLRLGDEPGDLRERRLRADLRRAHDEATERVDRRACDVGAGRDLDRHGLAGEHRLVDRRLALDDDAVGRDLLAGPDDEQVADRRARRSAPSTSTPSRRTRASFAPSSSSARIAAPERRRARASR